MNHKLIIFDFDGTLINWKSDHILPGVKEYFAAHQQCADTCFAIATNQGGVGLRHWMEQGKFGEPENYPDETVVYKRLMNFFRRLYGGDVFWNDVYISFAYRSKKSGDVSPNPFTWSRPPNGWQASHQIMWRKPSGIMLDKIMVAHNAHPDDTLMVGDRTEDRGAAHDVGCWFLEADRFFGRAANEDESV